MRYDETHTNRMDWAEFQNHVDTLIDKLNTYQDTHKINFDAVAPILRSGAIPATMIANKMRILPVIPLQVKYNYEGQKLSALITPICPVSLNKDDALNIMVVECNTCTNRSAVRVSEMLHETFPNADLHYVSVCKAYGNPDTFGTYKSFHYGRHSDELFLADDATKSELHLREGITIFPWETTEYELADVNGEAL